MTHSVLWVWPLCFWAYRWRNGRLSVLAGSDWFGPQRRFQHTIPCLSEPHRDLQQWAQSQSRYLKRRHWPLMTCEGHFLSLRFTLQVTSAMLRALTGCLSCPKVPSCLRQRWPIKERWQISQISWTLTPSTVSRYNKSHIRLIINYFITVYSQTLDNFPIRGKQSLCVVLFELHRK